MDAIRKWICRNADTLLIVGGCFVMVLSLTIARGIVWPESEYAGADVQVSGTEQTDWGLGFGESGKAPTGNVSQEELAKYNAYFIDDRWQERALEGAEGAGVKGAEGTDTEDAEGAGAEGGTKGSEGSNTGSSSEDGEGTETPSKPVYLTFDAGYENGYTAKLLDVLKAEKVPAAFFLVGNYVKDNPELVKRMVDEGHLVCNHTMHHPDMSKLSDKEDFAMELGELEELCRNAAGVEMAKIYRPPQGKFCLENLKNARERGYATVFWSLAYVDWLEDKQPTHEQALAKLNDRIHPGAIVLLHSTSKTNSEILEELIKGWKSQGFHFLRLDALI